MKSEQAGRRHERGQARETENEMENRNCTNKKHEKKIVKKRRTGRACERERDGDTKNECARERERAREGDKTRKRRENGKRASRLRARGE